MRLVHYTQLCFGNLSYGEVLDLWILDEVKVLVVPAGPALGSEMKAGRLCAETDSVLFFQ